MSEPFLGEIRAFAGNFAPTGWALCDGQLLSIQQNTALFSILGTFYGGNGTTNFALPDLRGRTMVGQGQGPGLSNYVQGQQTGVEQVTLLTSQIPAHTHTVTAQNGGGTQASPQGNFFAEDGSGKGAVPIYAPSPLSSPTTMAPTMIGTTGGSQPFTVLNPSLCISYIIALVGIFPSRN